MRLLRRIAGLGLLAAAYLPLHRLLDPALTGTAGAVTRATAEAAWTLSLSGTVIVLGLAWLGARMIGRSPRGASLGVWLAAMERPSPGAFALGIGAVAVTACAGVAVLVHGASPTSVDEMAQLLHARAVAAGLAGIPLDGAPASFVIQNGILTPSGWASIYPPLHTVLLALGLRLGAPWLVGPLAVGISTGAVTWTAERLVGARVGRVSGLLLVASPYWLLLGATYLSHSTAVAGLSLLAATAVRAKDGSAWWGLAAGAAAGVAVSARPWVGLVAGSAIVLIIWLPDLALRRSASSSPHARDAVGRAERGSLTVRIAPARLRAVALGGAPFALLLFGWNRRLFGHALELGYSAAFGPAHGLGWHIDPWGNRYGALEALAYTGADLSQLGSVLFASPLPAIALVGAFLLVRPLPKGSAAFAAWAAAGVLANAAYWHHGIHFGPRMLYESTPGWVVLFSAAAVSAFEGGTGTADRFARWVVGIAVVGGLALAPTTYRSATAHRLDVPTPAPASRPAVVFVHGSWASRVAARLAASGMRRDSIETALRRNGLCEVDRYARARIGGAGALPELEFDRLPGTPEHLMVREVSPGNSARVDPARQPDATCVREAGADRLGVLDLEPLAWRSPPLPGAELTVARDLGPAGNLAVLGTGERRAYVFIDRADDGPLLLEYAPGMELLWGGAAGRSAPSR